MSFVYSGTTQFSVRFKYRIWLVSKKTPIIRGSKYQSCHQFLLKTHMVDTVTCCSIGLKEAIDIEFFFKNYLEAW